MRAARPHQGYADVAAIREILLLGETAAPAVMTDAWREWSTMNYVRSALVLAAMVCELVVLGRLPRGA